jgi:hypothetical protein
LVCFCPPAEAATLYQLTSLAFMGIKESFTMTASILTKVSELIAKLIPLISGLIYSIAVLFVWSDKVGLCNSL